MTNASSLSFKHPHALHGRLLSRRELRRRIPVSDMTIWRWERDRHFPRHISVNGRNYWLMSEIEVWLEQQMGARDEG